MTDVDIEVLKKKKSRRVRELEEQNTKLKEEGLKLRVIINELKRLLAGAEADKKKLLMKEEDNAGKTLKETGLKEIEKVINSDNPEMEIAGIIGEREFYKERVGKLEESFREKSREQKKTEEQFHQKEADLVMLENVVNSMSSERQRMYTEFETEKKGIEEGYKEHEEILKKAFVALELAKRKFINEKNLVQTKLDDINMKFIEREKQIRVLSAALKMKEQDLYKEYIMKEKKYTDQIESLKKNIMVLEGRIAQSQKELREAVIKLNELGDYEEEEEETEAEGEEKKEGKGKEEKKKA
jgi:hypothetical protein